jgi:proteic killer suppression protein
MIETFKDKETEKVFAGIFSKKLPVDIQRTARRKLQIIHRAEKLITIAEIGGNQFEKLRGNREGQYSIRINDQFRICFEWKNGNAYYVEITDYH